MCSVLTSGPYLRLKSKYELSKSAVIILKIILVSDVKIPRHIFYTHSWFRNLLKPSSLKCLKLFECEAKEKRQHLQTSIPMDGNVMYYENLKVKIIKIKQNSNSIEYAPKTTCTNFIVFVQNICSFGIWFLQHAPKISWGSGMQLQSNDAVKWLLWKTSWPYHNVLVHSE